MSEQPPMEEASDPVSPPKLRLERASRPRSAYPSAYSREPEDQDLFAAGAEGPGLDSARLIEYVRIVHKRRWLAATAFVVVMAGTAIHTYSQIPVYEAQVRLLVEPDRQSVVGYKGLVEDETAAFIDFQTQYAIVNSRSFARKAMETLGIWEPSQRPAQPSPAPTGIAGVMANIRSELEGLVGKKDKPAPSAPVAASTTADSPEAQNARIAAFLSGVKVTPVPKSRLIEVSYTSTSPENAAAYANAVAKQYIEQNLEFKFLASKEASDWLAEKLTEQRRRVEAAEQAVQAYRERNQVVVSPDERVNASIARLGEYTSAMTKARTERLEKEAMYNQMRAVQGDRAALNSFQAVTSNPVVQELKAQLASAVRTHAQLAEKLLDRHPDLIKAQKNVEAIQARLDTEIANVVKSARTEFLAAKAAEDSLTEAYESQKRETLQTNRGGVEFAVLQRDAESNRQIYDSLMQRVRESNLVGEPKTNNIQILDAADVPRVPSGSSRARDLRYGALAGLTLAFALVWFFEYIDNRIKSPTDIQRYLGLPFLGLVPRLSDKKPRERDPLVSEHVTFEFAESFRCIRTNVLFSSAQPGMRSVVVTSAEPGDGKTLVSTNLAVSLAMAGQRVLLIDCDLRSPRVHNVFDVPQEPGLSNLLVGNARAAEVVCRTAIPGMSVLPAGRIPPNPAELLGSRRFIDFVAGLVSHFDWVIVDSPPAMPVTDPAVLGHSATATILVVSAEKTSRHAAREAVDRLESAGALVVGAVLNNVDLKTNTYYYARRYAEKYTAYARAAAKAR